MEFPFVPRHHTLQRLDTDMIGYGSIPLNCKYQKNDDQLKLINIISLFAGQIFKRTEQNRTNDKNARSFIQNL